MFQEGAIKTCEALSIHFTGELQCHVVFNLGTKFQCQELPRPHPQAMGHVVLGDDQVVAPVVLSPNDDMGVGLARVVMIYGHPIELGLQVPLHLRHEVTNEGFQIMKLCTVLRRHDQPELVAVMFASIQRLR